ncbi:MAG: hypothetical protein ACLQPD_22465 [Desulfomonilaceae bacterium]
MIYRAAPLNCLLMLSSRQSPHPRAEMKWHFEHWNETGKTTWIATTRLLSRELQAGKSEIAFYGDSELNNDYLGKAIYVRYVEISNQEAQEHLSSSLYKRGVPPTTRGFIGVKDVETADPGQSITDLQGMMRESARARRTKNSGHYLLSPENLPPSAARIQIYYYKVSDLQPDEQK